MIGSLLSLSTRVHQSIFPSPNTTLKSISKLNNTLLMFSTWEVKMRKAIKMPEKEPSKNKFKLKLPLRMKKMLEKPFKIGWRPQRTESLSWTTTMLEHGKQMIMVSSLISRKLMVVMIRRPYLLERELVPTGVELVMLPTTWDRQTFQPDLTHHLPMVSGDHIMPNKETLQENESFLQMLRDTEEALQLDLTLQEDPFMVHHHLLLSQFQFLLLPDMLQHSVITNNIGSRGSKESMLSTKKFNRSIKNNLRSLRLVKISEKESSQLTELKLSHIN